MADANNNNRAFGDDYEENNTESEDESGSEDEEGGEGFLNIELDARIRALLEGESDDEDEVFYGFDEALPDPPRADWVPHPQRTDRVQYTEQAGPTMHEPPGNSALSYFSLFIDDEFLEKVKDWTNENAARKLQGNPDANR